MSREHWINSIIFNCHTENDDSSYLRDKGEEEYTVTLNQVLCNSQLTRSLVSPAVVVDCYRLVPVTDNLFRAKGC